MLKRLLLMLALGTALVACTPTTPAATTAPSVSTPTEAAPSDAVPSESIMPSESASPAAS